MEQDKETEQMQIQLNGIPALIVSQLETGHFQHAITGLVDPECETIAAWSVLISDIMDQVVERYHQQTGKSREALRATLIKHWKIEEKCKKDDPFRGKVSRH